MNGKQSMAKRWMVAWLLVIWARAQGGPANVWIFDADPFLEPGARVVETYSSLDWSASPTGSGGVLEIDAERWDRALGWVAAGRRVLGPAPAAASFVLVNQVAPDVAVFDFGGRGVPVPGDLDGDGVPDDLPVAVEWVPPGANGEAGGLRWILPENAPEVVLEGVESLGGVWREEVPVVRERNGRKVLELAVDPAVPARFFRLRW